MTEFELNLVFFVPYSLIIDRPLNDFIHERSMCKQCNNFFSSFTGFDGKVSTNEIHFESDCSKF